MTKPVFAPYTPKIQRLNLKKKKRALQTVVVSVPSMSLTRPVHKGLA